MLILTMREPSLVALCGTLNQFTPHSQSGRIFFTIYVVTDIPSSQIVRNFRILKLFKKAKHVWSVVVTCVT